jgi:Mn-dependent DtxR family transcriptional regulator
MEKFVADGIISVNPNGNFDLTEKGSGIAQKLQEKFKIKD